MKTPKLTIVGAGPGDIELITVKAINALKTADVVLYDALINEDLLIYAKNALCVFVGKRKGCHSFMQSEINQLIVEMAYQYGHVVRLKGGDPFIFGRGGEEINFANEYGLETNIIPGISSSFAVPAINGISLTQRSIAESFWVLTGTTSNHNLSKDIYLASQSSATVVILMGMHKLDEIVAIYEQNDHADMPISIIQNGTTNKQKEVAGKISNISEKVKRENIGSPAIIVIGKVVEHKIVFNNMLKQSSFINEFKV